MKKEYLKPTMRVVEMRHRNYFICGSRAVTSVKSNLGSSSFVFEENEVDYEGEIR